MKSFRELIEDAKEDYLDDNLNWTKQDLITLIQEQDLGDDDIQEITELVIDMVEYSEFEDLSDEEFEDIDWSIYESKSEEYDELDEKMSPKAKKEAAKKRKKPAFKKAMRLKKKCMAKMGDKVRKSGGKLTCGTDGKLKKGMSKADRRKLMKSRKKNKNKIIK